MTNDTTKEKNFNYGHDDERFTPQAWQDYVRRKIQTQTSRTILEDSGQENEIPGSAKLKNYKGLMKNCILDNSGYGDDEEVGFCKDKRTERVKDFGVEDQLFSGANFEHVGDSKKKSKKDLRVSFKERVHLISPDIRQGPTTQKLKLGDDDNFRSNSSLPFLENNNECSKAVYRSKRKESGRSSSAKVKNSAFTAYVDGTSMSRSGRISMKGLERFLPQVSLAQCNDFDSAVIEIVREYNDPCRGVHGDSIDLYF